MKRHSQYIFLCFLMVCLTALTGCGKSRTPAPNISETIQEAVTAPTQTSQLPDITEPEATPDFNYRPNPWAGAYIMADPSIEVGAEVLDNVTMTTPEFVTSHRVSNRQIDFVYQDKFQAGGLLLVDIPRDLLEEASQSKDAFLELSDLLGKQVMGSLYPAEAEIHGGGHITNSKEYLFVFYKTAQRDGIKNQYMHQIFIGKEYCYDFWIDESYWNESGETITASLSSPDISPDLNNVDFTWSYNE